MPSWQWPSVWGAILKAYFIGKGLTMARDDAPPFGRGETLYGGETIDSTDLPGINLEGREYRFEDSVYGTGQQVVVRIVRNVAAAALIPKKLVSFKTTYYGQRVDGYATTWGQNSYPVDELLPAAGVAVNDLFYIVVKGPALCLTDLSADANNVITLGDILVSQTAATSGATTSGRVVSQTVAATTAVDLDVLKASVHYIGHAMSAKTTANTNAGVLINIKF